MTCGFLWGATYCCLCPSLKEDRRPPDCECGHALFWFMICSPSWGVGVETGTPKCCTWAAPASGVTPSSFGGIQNEGQTSVHTSVERGAISCHSLNTWNWKGSRRWKAGLAQSLFCFPLPLSVTLWSEWVVWASWKIRKFFKHPEELEQQKKIA